ncbi:MAG TPA: response regulator transcription factor, partial [Actinomycetota bacterium]|nr:response regulator transcription factor [Actinomycetota bacterium]
MYLSREGFQVLVESDGQRALSAVSEFRPSCILLDVGLPGMDGIEVCRRLRADQDWTPVLFCTARDDEVDRVLGLELGADDYITKPFSVRELCARVKAQLRRSKRMETTNAPEQTSGGLRVDGANYKAYIGDTELTLTLKEFELLSL